MWLWFMNWINVHSYTWSWNVCCKFYCFWSFREVRNENEQSKPTFYWLWWVKLFINMENHSMMKIMSIGILILNSEFVDKWLSKRKQLDWYQRVNLWAKESGGALVSKWVLVGSITVNISRFCYLILWTRPESNVLLFRRPLGTDGTTGLVDVEKANALKKQFRKEYGLDS